MERLSYEEQGKISTSTGKEKDMKKMLMMYIKFILGTML